MDGRYALCAALFLAPGRHRSSEGPDVGEFQKGIAYTGYSGTAYEGSGPLQSLDELALTNASWISLLVTGYQETIHTTAIDYAGPGTPNDASLSGSSPTPTGKG